jgi:hypothetical protein
MSYLKFRKKPVVIEAIQFTGGPKSATEVLNWVETPQANHRLERELLHAPNGEISQLFSPEHIRIRTLEGDMMALVGDWIIKGVKGEFYPCKPDIFEATYEAVEA